MTSNDENDVTVGTARARLKGANGDWGEGRWRLDDDDDDDRTKGCKHRTREHGDASPPTDGMERWRLLGAIARATRRTREIAAGQSEPVPRDPTSPRAGP